MQADGKCNAKAHLTKAYLAKARLAKGYLSKVSLPEEMTRAQGLRLKRLSEEAHQPGQYQRDLSFGDAARRIAALQAEIALADSF